MSVFKIILLNNIAQSLKTKICIHLKFSYTYLVKYINFVFNLILFINSTCDSVFFYNI